MPELKFAPVISAEMKTPDFRAYMVETAWDYYITAHSCENRRGYIETSLSCLSLEILLKSFNADVVANLGKLNEQYQPNEKVKKLRGRNAHDLIKLYELLHPDYQRYLFKPSDLDVLDKHRNLFLSDRYGYESTASSVHYDAISKLAATSVCKVVFLYKDRGSKDPFILNFDETEVYFTHVQRVLFI